MNILAIDASTSFELISVLKGNSISDKTSIVKKTHSITLFDNIQSALTEVKITIKELDLIGVGVGPGSFTGIRIAVSTARMLSQLLKIPLIGIHTPDIYAASVKSESNDNILVAFDAKKGRIFGSLYRNTTDGTKPALIIPPGDYPIEHLIENSDKNQQLFLVGDGALKYYKELTKKRDKLILLENFIPSGEVACKITEEKYFTEPNLYKDYNSVLPFYARKSDAEVMRDKEKKNRV